MRARHGDLVWLEHSGVLSVRRPLRRRSGGLIEFELASQAGRYEGSQFLRRQQELTRTIGPVSFQGEDQRLFIDEAQSAAGDGRADHVAAEPFEPTSVGGLDAGGGLQ